MNEHTWSELSDLHQNPSMLESTYLDRIYPIYKSAIIQKPTLILLLSTMKRVLIQLSLKSTSQAKLV